MDYNVILRYPLLQIRPTFTLVPSYDVILEDGGRKSGER